MAQQIYAFYPLDNSDKAVGVYVGITSCVERRMAEHVRDEIWYDHGKQVTNFAYQVLCEVDDASLEYDFIGLLALTGLPLLNQRFGTNPNPQRALRKLISNNSEFRFIRKEEG